MVIKNGDYIVVEKDTNGVERRSVGLVREISGQTALVFFIGVGKDIKVDTNDISYIDIENIGEKKAIKKKICNVCHKLKEISEFDRNQTDAKGQPTTRPSCKACRVAIDGTPMSRSEDQRLNRIKPTGIFTCPICQKTTIVGVTANLVKDHDHITGKGREWICDSCNTGLGRFKDSIELLQRAINYLKKYS